MEIEQVGVEPRPALLPSRTKPNKQPLSGPEIVYSNSGGESLTVSSLEPVGGSTNNAGQSNTNNIRNGRKVEPAKVFPRTRGKLLTTRFNESTDMDAEYVPSLDLKENMSPYEFILNYKPDRSGGEPMLKNSGKGHKFGLNKVM